MNKIYKYLIFCLIIFIAGCGGTSKISYSKNFKTKQIKNIAVLDFKEVIPGIDSNYLADKFATFLLGSDRFSVIDRHEIQKVMEEVRFQQSGIVDQETVKKLRQLGADAIITGILVKYNQINGSKNFIRHSSVQVLAKMIDVETGEVLWSVDIAKESVGKREGVKKLVGGESSAKSREELLNDVFEEIANSLLKDKKFILF